MARCSISTSTAPTYATAVADKLRLRGIPYIFVTGHAPPAGLKHRDVPVLRKPFTDIELRTALLALWDK